MTERPIIFNDAMSLAVIEGRKTVTRRPLVINGAPARCTWWDHAGFKPVVREGYVRWEHSDGSIVTGYAKDLAPSPRVPFGVPGDKLWVREAWSLPPSALSVYYRAGNGARLLSSHDASDNMESVNAWVNKLSRVAGPSVWAPSIHMPRWASRTVLDVLDVRVERLQSMTEEDARAEGFESLAAFILTWESIYIATMPWTSNPWVWVIEFRRAT